MSLKVSTIIQKALTAVLWDASQILAFLPRPRAVLQASYA
jgi:hypothetical protein